MSREPILLIPPMMCDARAFASQIADLSREGAVMVAPPVSGERIEDIALAIMDQAPRRFALVGAGALGGAVALDILRRVPERVMRIALISATPQGETPQMASAREPLIVAARSGRFGDVIGEEMNPAWLADGPSRLRVAQEVADMAWAMGPEGYVRQARAMQRRKDQQTVLRKVACPCMVLCGEEDALLPPRRHEFLAELIGGAQLVVVPGAGHLPMLEQPDAVSNALREWMRMPVMLR